MISFLLFILVIHKYGIQSIKSSAACGCHTVTVHSVSFVRLEALIRIGTAWCCSLQQHGTCTIHANNTIYRKQSHANFGLQQYQKGTRSKQLNFIIIISSIATTMGVLRTIFWRRSKGQRPFSNNNNANTVKKWNGSDDHEYYLQDVDSSDGQSSVGTVLQIEDNGSIEAAMIEMNVGPLAITHQQYHQDNSTHHDGDADQGGVPQLVQILLKYKYHHYCRKDADSDADSSSSESSTAYTTTTTSSLTTTTTSCLPVEIMDEASVATIVTILWEHASHVRTQIMGLEILRQLAMTSRRHRTWIVRAGGIPVLQLALLYHTTISSTTCATKTIQECACATLELVCKRSKHRRALEDVACCEGVVDSVVMTLSSTTTNAPTSVGVVQHGMGVLAKLARDKTYAALMVDKGVILLAFAAMDTHSHFQPIALVVLNLLKSLANNHVLLSSSSRSSNDWDHVYEEDDRDDDDEVDDENCLSVNELLSGLETLVKMMKCNSNNVLVQAKSVEFLATLVMSEFQATQLALTATFEKQTVDQNDGDSLYGVDGYSHDLDDRVFAAMNDRYKRPYSQHIASLVPKFGSIDNNKAKLSNGTICKAVATTTGGVDAVIQSMTACQDDPDLQMNACIVLGSLAAVASAGHAICQAGGYRAVLAALKNHSSHAGVQKNGCVALANIWSCKFMSIKNGSYDSDSAGKDDLAKYFAEGVEAILRAMNLHRSNIQVQTIGCRALHYFGLCQELETKDNDAVESSWQADQVISEVLSAMRYHKEDSGLQELGGKVTASAVLCEEGIAAIEEARGIETILKSVADCGSSAATKVGCCIALLHLSADEKGREVMAQFGANEILVLLIKHHLNDAKLVELAVLVIHNLSLSPTCCECLASIGAIQILIDAMKAHMGAASIQASCCDALWALNATDVSNQLDMVSAGCAGAILEVMAEYKDVTRVQACGIMALSGLAGFACDNGSLDHGKLVNVSGAVLKNHSDNADLLCYSFRLLAELFQGHPEVATKEVIDSVCHCIMAHKCHANVNISGTHLLATLYIAQHPTLADLEINIGKTVLWSALNCVGGNNETVRLKLLHDIATIGKHSGALGVSTVAAISNQVMLAQEFHLDNWHIQEISFSIYEELCHTAVGRQSLSSELFLSSLLAAIDSQRSSVPIQRAAFKVLLKLFQQESNTVQVSALSGAQAIARTMIYHGDESRLQTTGCILLWQLSGLEMEQPQEVIDALVSAAEANPLHKVIQKYSICAVEELESRRSHQWAFIFQPKELLSSVRGYLAAILLGHFIWFTFCGAVWGYYRVFR